MNDKKTQTILFIATGGWIGYAPVAPGTFGSLAGLPLCLLIAWMGHGWGLIVLAATLMTSTWIAHEAEKRLGHKDPGAVVIDEICGMAVALYGLPFEPVYVISGFALFRLFDIIKPFPIRWADRKVAGGAGIMLDDILAGILANIVIRVGVVLHG